MKYLMLIYGESESMDSEALTTKIGKEIQPIVVSEQIKYIYGDGNAIFHFESDMKYEEMSIYVEIIFEELGDIMYVLIPFNGKLASNMGKERQNHLMSIDNEKSDEEKIEIKTIKIDLSDKNFDEKSFFDIFVNILNQNNPFINEKNTEEVCNMTLDELLDKISETGINSLTDAEKLKLEEYSK